MSNSLAQKTMTENLHPRNKKLAKGHFQFLRLNEIYLLRAAHKTFVERRKNRYRTDILSHLTTEVIITALAAFPDAAREETTLNNNINTLIDAGIILTHGTRKSYPQYRQKNEVLEQVVLRLRMHHSDTIYEFDVAKVRDILRLLHSIEYIELHLRHREILEALTCAPEDGWWVASTLDTTKVDIIDFTRKLCERQDDETLLRLVDMDTSGKTYNYRITEFGKKVIDVWNEVTQLIEKPNEEAPNQAEHRIRETTTSEEAA